ncbi:MAG: hypothetical protein NTW17_00600 [Candidatus Pacearchaeota archaeon]|nr:hypothetical protein [Candidatus Pacearchaeota archaeon]
MLKKTNKRVWIRIVETFAAILIIAGITLLVIGRNNSKEENLSSKAYNDEISMLGEIQLNSTVRDEIIGIDASNLPVEWTGFDTAANITKAKINESTPSYLECIGKICSTNSSCLYTGTNLPEKSIYSQSVVISANLETYSPKLLKLFCWEK